MKLETFFEKFDLLSDAPDAVDKMREQIRTLGVSGRLYGGPGATEWPCIRLKEVCAQITDGEHATPHRISNGVPLATAKNVRDGFLDLTNTDYVANSTAVKCWKRCKPQHQDLLMVCVGATTGRVCLVRNPPDIVLVRSVALIRPNAERIAPSYLDLFLRSSSGQAQIWANVKQSAQPCLYLGKMAEFVINLPPLDEQERIVAKVDELMALCDRLEAQQQERETRHAALARASLSRFADAPTPANLNFIFHKSYDISPADIRKAILSLAVQGKLVPQDTNDEPAEKLIERVSAALPNKKSENPFIGKIEVSITDESDYELPHGWAWLPLGHVGIWATGCGFPTQYQGDADREFLFCKVSDMNLPGNEVEIQKTVHTIDADVMKKIRARTNPAGTVIFPKIGGAIATNKRRLVIKPTIIDNNCSGLQPIGLTDNRWLLYFMRKLDLAKYQSGTSVPAVSQSSLDPIRIGLPPLAEQRRIVAKVDQLMTLVDQLEAQIEKSRETGEKLLEAVVADLTAA